MACTRGSSRIPAAVGHLRDNDSRSLMAALWDRKSARDSQGQQGVECRSAEARLSSHFTRFPQTPLQNCDA